MRSPPLTEAQWQQRVVDYAHRCGWWVLHHPDSRRATAAGWPDLALLRERLVLAELKSPRGVLRPEQADVLARLDRAGVETHVWRPVDWPQVMRILGRQP